MQVGRKGRRTFASKAKGDILGKYVFGMCGEQGDVLQRGRGVSARGERRRRILQVQAGDWATTCRARVSSLPLHFCKSSW